MSTVKAVASVIPGVMSIGLLGRTMSYLPTEKELKGKAKMKPIKSIKLFTEISITVPLIDATAGVVNKLP